MDAIILFYFILFTCHVFASCVTYETLHDYVGT